MKKYVMNYKIGKVTGRVILNIPEFSLDMSVGEYVRDVWQFTSTLSDFNDNFRKSKAIVDRKIIEEE